MMTDVAIIAGEPSRLPDPETWWKTVKQVLGEIMTKILSVRPSTGARRRLKATRLVMALSLVSGLASLAALMATATPAAAAGATTTCTAPASGGTTTTFYVGAGAQTFSVACYGSGLSTATYPTSITVNTGALPSDATFPTTTPGCTQSTSGSGTSEHYILTCVISETPVSGDIGSYAATFLATGGGTAPNATSGALTLNVSNPLTTCTAPAAGGSSTTFTIGSADSYSVACYGNGLTTATYPSSITINSGTLPADATYPTTTPGCTQSTSGSGTAEHYILTCVIHETPTSADAGTYHLTFLATGGGGATSTTSGTLTLTVAPVAPTFHAGQYFNGVAGVPFCFDAAADTVTAANGGLPLTSITLGSTPAGVTNYSLQNVNLTAGTAQLCGTISSAEESHTVTMAPVFTNSGGSVTGSVTLSAYGSCSWTSSAGTTSLFDANQDLYQSGSQSAFGAPITNGETVGSTTNYATCTQAMYLGAGLGGASTVLTANPLPTPTDSNPSANQGDLSSSNLELGKGCYGSAHIGNGAVYTNFGSGTVLTVPSPWVNGGTCSYGIGSNSAGGNTDSFATCPPTQADVNEGYLSCSILASSGNNDSGANTSFTYSSDDLFFTGQPVPQQSTATLSAAAAQPGDTVSVTGGTNWWGGGGGAEPNAGPYGDSQIGSYHQVGAPSVFIGTSRATAVPVASSTVTLTANTYACTGAESSSVGPNPCTMTPGGPTGSVTLPAGLAPGTYNLYIDATNTSPLPGNGPNDAYQTARGTNLGTDESVTPIDVEGVMVVKTSTTSSYGAAGQTLSYNYNVTNTGPDTLTGIQVNDNLIPSANISCPSSSLAGNSSETCTGTYTTTQADVDRGYVTNTATVSGTSPSSETITSAPSSATVDASDATSSLSLTKSTDSTGYGAAGDTINYSYLVTNTGTTTLSGISVADNLVASVSCPDPSLAPGASETCTGTYTVTQNDVDTGSVTNTATANGTNPSAVTVNSSPSAVTVLASDATSTLRLVKSTTSTGYGTAGDTINYTYLVTNTGTTTLSAWGVNDNLIGSASCPGGSLAPGASETCTGSYTVTQADVDAGSVTNTATASATGPYANAVTSNPSSVTVDASDATSTLSLVKSTSSTGYGKAGDTINYSYLVTNTGTTTLSGVGVTDNLVTSVSCPDPSLAPGASEICTGSYAVSQANVDNGSVTNTATADATAPPGGNPVSSNPSSVTVSASDATASLSLVKSSDTVNYAAAGDTVDYSYLVTNTGTTTLSGVGVTDNLVASVSCPDPSLAPGASETCTGSYTVTQADVDAGSVTNTATASATDPHANAVSSNSSMVTVPAFSTSSLSLVKSTTSTGYGAAGDTIDYSYLVTNTGVTTLSAVGVTDNLVASVSCPDSSLAPGASETCTGSYTVTQADVDNGSVTNTATASATNPQDHPVSSASSTVTVEASNATSTLSLVKSTTSTGYGAGGDTIAYSYLVTNTGTTTLSAVSVSDNLIGSASCTPGSLAPGASETCTGSYTVTQADVDAGSVTNTATASASNPQDVTVTSGSSTVTVEASDATTSMSLVKSTSSGGYGAAGDTIHYGYLVTNTGTTTLSGVGVADNLVASVSCPDPSLAPGAAETCTGSYTVTQADVDAGSVTNTATASATGPYANGVNSGPSSVTVLASNATTSISLTKSTNSTGYAKAGDVIHYSYVVTNSGTTTLSGVGVADNLIASVSCPDSSLAPGASETCTGSYTATQADVDAGSVTNTATANATGPYANGVSSGSSSVTVLASGAASSLSLTKSTTSTGYGKTGDVIDYTYLVTNTGTTTLSNVGVTDNLIAHVSCPDSSLAPGASETCTGSYTATQADVDNGSVTNTATATATNPQDAPVTSGSSSVTVDASQATSYLGLVKSTTSTGYGQAGDTIHYSYAVTNTGTTTLSGVGVTDNRVAHVSCPDPSLAPGASETCTGSYTVTQVDVDAGSVTNTATATATAPDPHTVSSNSSSVTVDASGATSSLSLVKSTSATSFTRAGQVLTYSYKVTNTGTTTLSALSVTDTLIAAVSCPDSSLAPGASETCTGSYTVTQEDVDNGYVTNTGTAHGAAPPHSTPVVSSPSSVTVHYGGVVITTTSLPTLTEGTPYSDQLTASGGVAPYTWKTLAGLPKGLKLSKKGVLSGTVAKKVVPGTYTISVEVTDSTKKGHEKDAAFLSLVIVY